MVLKPSQAQEKLSVSYHIRKLAKSGNSRYLSVGKIVPTDWEVVKVIVLKRDDDSCTLRLEQIK